MPPTRSHRASSAPVAPPNNGHGQNDRPPIEAGELCVGCIVWLPHKVSPAHSIKCNKVNCCGKELEEGGYEHPVVVLSVKQREGSHILRDLICTVACITTFTDTSLPKYLRRRARVSHYQSSIPIFHRSTAIVDTETTDLVEQLYIENGTLHKQSYVTLQHTYEIPSSTLCQYNFRARRAYSLRLKETSYNLLMKKLDMDAQTFILTAQMLSTHESRLAVLAGIPATRIIWNTPSPSPSPPPRLPHSPAPYRSALLYGTAPTTSTQPLPSRVQPPRYHSAPNRVTLPPPNHYNTTSSPSSHYHNSTYYGSISSSVPTYQPPVQSRRYTPPEPSRPADNGNDGDVSTFVTLVVVIVIGALLYWKFW